MTRLELTEADLEELAPERQRIWKVIARVILTRRVEESDLGEVATDLTFDEREMEKTLERLAGSWVNEWRIYEPEVDEALRRRTRETGRSRSEAKKEVLQTAILLGLRDADEEQVTRIGRDRARGHGSRLVLMQKQDLKNPEEQGRAQKHRCRPAGLRVFPSEGLLSPIEAALLGHVTDPERVRPLDLRPALLLRWLRTRALKLAKKRLLEEAGLGPDDAPDSFREVEVRHPHSDLNEEPANHEEVSPRELLEALDREDPDPLEPLIATEQRHELTEVATSGQLEYLQAVSKKCAEGMNEAEAIKQVAKEKEVKPNTVHKNLQRLRDRAADHVSADSCQVSPTSEHM